jgi:heavy metal sensor kinase
MRLMNLEGRDLFVPGNQPVDAEALGAARDGQARYSDVEFEGEPWRVLTRPVQPQGTVLGVVQVATSLAPTDEALDQVTRTLLIWLPLALLMAGVGGAFLTGRALRPVRDITRAAARIEARNLSERLPVQGQDEFSRLAAMLNGMLGRLEDAFERQKRFTADASHELRTPLATIKATSSLAREDEWGAAELQEAMGTIETAADRTQRILQDLLLLARSDNGQLTLPMRPLALSAVLDAALAEARAGGGEAGRAEWPRVALPLDAGSPLWVWGDDLHLVRLFVNLLQNAQRHTPPDGRITVTAAATERGVTVTVTDTGEGIAPEHLPHLGERFYRADAARSRARGGSGLGLAICRSIVEAHGGDLEIDSVLGQGTAVTVTLQRSDPLADAPAEV